MPDYDGRGPPGGGGQGSGRQLGFCYNNNTDINNLPPRTGRPRGLNRMLNEQPQGRGFGLGDRGLGRGRRGGW